MGINNEAREGCIDAEVLYPDNGLGGHTIVVSMTIHIHGKPITFTSEKFHSDASAERVARYVDGKRVT